MEAYIPCPLRDVAFAAAGFTVDVTEARRQLELLAGVVRAAGLNESRVLKE